jgi:hypothetical protein
MKLTKQQFLNLDPCPEAIQFAKKIQFNPVIGWNSCERGDWLIWLLRNTNQLEKTKSVRLAIAFAEHVLPLFESKNPKDFRPRKALKAAKDWLSNPSPQTTAAADAAAADAADAAGDAASAASSAASSAAAAAANAAAASAAAAFASAFAASAASATAWTGCAASANLTEKKWQAEKIRELIKCPFES